MTEVKALLTNNAAQPWSDVGEVVGSSDERRQAEG